MKKYFAALSATALISIAPYVLAASSTDLTVTGTITPSACTPSFSNGGVVDNGKVSAKDLNLTSNTLIGTHPLQLTVACDAAVPFALDGVDNNATSALADNWFGLGMTDSGEKLGLFRANIISAVGDGQPVRPISRHSSQNYWQQTSVLGKGVLTSVGGRFDAPLAVKDLTMDLEIITYIAPANSLTLTDEVTMDGSATFVMTYL